MAVDYHEYIKTEAWRERAEAAKQRVEHRCQICNRPSKRVTLDVHHRTYERLGNERPEDLTVLCRGCHELYEKNRRIPSPPPTAPAPAPLSAPTTRETVSTQPSQQPVAVLNGVAPRRPFAPARISPQRAALLATEETAELLLLPETDHGYTLAPAPATTHYDLTPEQANQPAATSTAHVYHPRRRWQVSVALLVAVTLLLVAGLYDMVTLTPNALRPLTTNTRQPAVSNTSSATTTAQPTVAALAHSQPTATQAAVIVQSPATPTTVPTLPATVLPTATALPLIQPTVASTVTATVEATLASTPQSLVLRSGLVCSKPCSCAPVVRTITQGTPVTVVQTQLCGSDTWTQIGEAEWLGPGLVDQ